MMKDERGAEKSCSGVQRLVCSQRDLCSVQSRGTGEYIKQVSLARGRVRNTRNSRFGLGISEGDGGAGRQLCIRPVEKTEMPGPHSHGDASRTCGA